MQVTADVILCDLHLKTLCFSGQSINNSKLKLIDCCLWQLLKHVGAHWIYTPLVRTSPENFVYGNPIYLQVFKQHLPSPSAMHQKMEFLQKLNRNISGTISAIGSMSTPPRPLPLFPLRHLPFNHGPADLSTQPARPSNRSAAGTVQTLSVGRGSVSAAMRKDEAEAYFSFR
ncbi:MAG: hypothetical protein WBB98_15050 [Xanthobacteraceae bacterium]